MIVTSRLSLRALRDDDANAISQLAGDELVAQHCDNLPHPYSLAQAQTYIDWQRRASLRGEECVFAVCRADQLIGCVSGIFSSVTLSESRSAELGYWFAADVWGQGYASEAGQAMLAYLFVAHQLHKLTAEHAPSNVASGRVLSKLGFSLQGFNATGDTLQYQLLKSDWLK